MTTEFLYSELSVRDIITTLSSFILELKNQYTKYFKDDEFNAFLIITIENGLKIYKKGINVEAEQFFCDLIHNNLLIEINKLDSAKLNKILQFIENKIIIEDSLYINVNNIKRIKKYIKKRVLSLILK